MKTFLPLVLTVWTLNLKTIAADSSKVDGAEFYRLLSETVPQSRVRYILSMVERPELAETKEELAAARDLIAKTKANIPKLRQMIKVGSNIFDYPGILGHGAITYVELIDLGIPFRPGENSYRLRLGIPLSHEGVEQWGFSVTFSEKGVITAVENVHVKH